MLMDQYLDRIREILDRIRETQRDGILRAAEYVSQTIMAGGVVHIFGTGHSHLIAEEAFFRAGGIAGINAMLDSCFLFTDGARKSTLMERVPGAARTVAETHVINPEDVAIIVSNSGRNVAPVEMALEMKSRGLKVIAVTSLSHSRAVSPLHSSGKRLCEVADVVLDNCGEYGDAVVSIPGVQFKAGPTSTIAGAALIHCVMIESVGKILKAGHSPVVFPSANVEGAELSRLAKEIEQYRGRIKHY